MLTKISKNLKRKIIMCRVWPEEDRGTCRRPTGQPRRAAEGQDRGFRQLAHLTAMSTSRSNFPRYGF